MKNEEVEELIKNLKNLAIENKVKKLIKEVLSCNDITYVEKYHMMLKLKRIMVSVDEFKNELTSKKPQLVRKMNQHLKIER